MTLTEISMAAAHDVNRHVDISGRRSRSLINYGLFLRIRLFGVRDLHPLNGG